MTRFTSDISPSVSRRRNITRGICVIALAFAVAGCANARKYVGLEKDVPDETQVETNRPLSMPPDIALKPPADAPAPARQPAPSALPAPGAAPAPMPAPAQNSQPRSTRTTQNSNGAQPIQPWSPRRPAPAAPAPQPVQNAAPQPINPGAPQAQPAQAQPVQGQPPQTTQTAQASPQKRMTPEEYSAHVERLRKEDIARRKARNPNYGTWKNLWNVIWN